MRFRTLALALALSCGVAGMAQAAAKKTTVGSVKHRKAKKAKKIKKSKTGRKYKHAKTPKVKASTIERQN
jgi:hypothetical protein